MFREMRRKEKLMDNEAGIELLKKCSYGVLSLFGDDDYPYGVPVNYAYKDNCIYIHGFLSGHKIDAIQNHSKVCFTVVGETEVLKQQVTTNYVSVIAFGKAEIILSPNNAERENAFSVLMERFIPGEEERTSKYIKAHEANTSVIKIVIEHMTCKRSLRS